MQFYNRHCDVHDHDIGKDWATVMTTDSTVTPSALTVVANPTNRVHYHRIMEQVNTQVFGTGTELVLCGDACMDFIHRPKS
jgi:hypothetical protein